jgi:hypothetical protein
MFRIVGSEDRHLCDVEVSVIRTGLVQLWKLLAPYKVLLGFIAVNAVVILALLWGARLASLEAELNYGPQPKTDRHVWINKSRMNPIVRPSTVRPGEAELPENDSVIGVVVDGNARAYALRSLRHLRQHVVNDLIGGVPISVTHCDVTECTHVYASRKRSEPLDIRQAGFRDGQMILKIEGVYYGHSSGEPIEPGPGSRPLPYEGHPWTQTTWKEWRQQYPETDIYVDERP